MKKVTNRFAKMPRDELERLCAQYEILLFNSNVGFIVYKQDTSILMCNTRAEEILGINMVQSKEQKILNPPAVLLTENGKPINGPDYLVNKVIKTKQSFKNQVFGLRRPGNKSTKWLMVEGYPIFDKAGGLSVVVITITDITTLKRNNDSLLETNKKIRENSVRDTLTKLFNRGYFYDKLKMEMSQSKRSNQSMSLLLIDIDHFKSINDKYGHPQGDKVLLFFAEIAKRHVVEPGFTARHGGEEFVCILPMTTLDDAVDIAENMKTEFGIEQFVTKNGEEFNVTISIGVVEYDKNEEPDELISRADALLYQAKENGRNKVCF